MSGHAQHAPGAGSDDADLCDALRANLEDGGVLQQLRAALYAEAMARVGDSSSVLPPRPPAEALLINDLIREYLSFSGLKHSLAVFDLETGAASSAHSAAPPQRREEGGTLLPRSVLADELGGDRDARPIPLLYSLVATARAARTVGLASMGAGASESLNHPHVGASYSASWAEMAPKRVVESAVDATMREASLRLEARSAGVNGVNAGARSGGGGGAALRDSNVLQGHVSRDATRQAKGDALFASTLVSPPLVVFNGR